MISLLSFLNILNMEYIVAYKDGKFKCIRFFVLHIYCGKSNSEIIIYKVLVEYPSSTFENSV